MGSTTRPSLVATAGRLVPVTFRVPPGLAEHAQLVAEFTSWTPLAMDRLGDGSHVLRVLLPAGGSWGFQFVLDDAVTINDASADTFRPGPGHAYVSVVRT